MEQDVENAIEFAMPHHHTTCRTGCSIYYHTDGMFIHTNIVQVGIGQLSIAGIKNTYFC